MKRTILIIAAATASVLFAGCGADESTTKEPTPLEQVRDNGKESAEPVEAAPEEAVAEEAEPPEPSAEELAAEAHEAKMQAREFQIDMFNGYADSFARELMQFDYSERSMAMLAIDIDNIRFVTDQETDDPELDAAYDIVREGLDTMTAGIVALDAAQIEAGGKRFMEGKDAVNALPLK